MCKLKVPLARGDETACKAREGVGEGEGRSLWRRLDERESPRGKRGKRIIGVRGLPVIFLPSGDRSHGGGHGGGGVTQQEARRQNAANVIVYGQGSVEVRAVTVVASKSCRSRSRTRVQTAHGMLFSKMRQRRDI